MLADNAILVHNPVGIWGMLACFGGAILAAWRFLGPALKNKRIQKSIGYGLGLDEVMGKDAPDLTKAVLAFIDGMQKDRQEDRRETARQWERIESILVAIKDQSGDIKDLTVAIQHTADHFHQIHEHHAQAISRIESNQNQMATFIYQNRNGNYQQQPQARVG